MASLLARNPIAVVRDWRGITRVALADAAGIRQSYVADLESGQRGDSPKQLGAVPAPLKAPARFARIYALGRCRTSYGFIARFSSNERRGDARPPGRSGCKEVCRHGAPQASHSLHDGSPIVQNAARVPLAGESRWDKFSRGSKARRVRSHEPLC